MKLFGHLFLRSDQQANEPVRKICSASQQRKIATILKDISGLGCRIIKPIDKGGLGWIIDTTGTDIPYPPGQAPNTLQTHVVYDEFSTTQSVGAASTDDMILNDSGSDLEWNGVRIQNNGVEVEFNVARQGAYRCVADVAISLVVNGAWTPEMSYCKLRWHYDRAAPTPYYWYAIQPLFYLGGYGPAGADLRVSMHSEIVVVIPPNDAGAPLADFVPAGGAVDLVRCDTPKLRLKVTNEFTQGGITVPSVHVTVEPLHDPRLAETYGG